MLELDSARFGESCDTGASRTANETSIRKWKKYRLAFMVLHSASHVSSSDAPEEVTVMIFGASGDLTSRKLIPALFSLFRNGYLSAKSVILGVARRPKSHDEFRAEMREEFADHKGTTGWEQDWNRFQQLLHYVQVDLKQPEDFATLRATAEALEQERQLGGKRVVYLATAPELFLPSIQNLSAAGLAPQDASKLRVVISSRRS